MGIIGYQMWRIWNKYMGGPVLLNSMNNIWNNSMEQRRLDADILETLEMEWGWFMCHCLTTNMIYVDIPIT